MEYIQDTLFGKTLQELSPVTKERTSDAFSKQCAESQMKKFMCLRLTSGNRQDASWGALLSCVANIRCSVVGSSPKKKTYLPCRRFCRGMCLRNTF